VNYAQILADALGAPTSVRRATADAIKAIGTVPKGLDTLWHEQGWAGYRGGFYWTTDPADFNDVIRNWRRIPKDAMTIGRDAFANLYILEGEEVWQLNVHQDEHAMVSPTLDMFYLACVAKESFRTGYMWDELFQKALKAEGALAEDECYGFFPALALGGSGDAESLRRVKLFEHLSMLSQLHG